MSAVLSDFRGALRRIESVGPWLRAALPEADLTLSGTRLTRDTGNTQDTAHIA
ncbi:hypothetical protein ACFV5G_20785 [Streptomyces sp. NPDC059766]|uniref:hypothetical protein n=1 Tax=Streptomyces sp. NPDC059766 TaxID=3346940 RepID=UPI00364F5261